MTPDVWTPIAAAAGTRAVALLGYLTARVRANAAAIATHQAALLAAGGAELLGLGPARGPARGLRQDRVPARAVGAPPAAPADPWAAAPDEACGEQCCARVIDQQHGVTVPAAYLRDALGGAQRTGRTTATDLVRLLALGNVACAVRTPEVADLAAFLQATTGAGRVALVLGHWDAGPALRWVLCDRADARGARYLDPQSGGREHQAWAQFTPRSAGLAVEVLRAAVALP